jgi:hypothetical protein
MDDFSAKLRRLAELARHFADCADKTPGIVRGLEIDADDFHLLCEELRPEVVRRFKE